MNDELTELHPDKQLALRIENGEVSMDEVRHVWEETRDLSAQTDFDTRRAVVALRKCGSLNDAWPVFFTEITTQLSRMAGAMTNENSKFAHLVAGATDIVRTMQAINPLAERLDQLARENRELNAKMDEILKRLGPQLIVEPEKPQSDAVEPEPMDWEDKDLEARKRTIGSAW